MQADVKAAGIEFKIDNAKSNIVFPRFSKHDFDIAVIAIPAENAPAVVKQVVRAGIKAVLNFAPVQLSVPADVTVRNVNMAMELEGLSFALRNRAE